MKKADPSSANRLAGLNKPKKPQRRAAAAAGTPRSMTAEELESKTLRDLQLEQIEANSQWLIQALGRQIKAGRVRVLGKTSRQFAEMIDVSLPTLRRMENGEGGTLESFAKALAAMRVHFAVAKAANPAAEERSNMPSAQPQSLMELAGVAPKTPATPVDGLADDSDERDGGVEDGAEGGAERESSPSRVRSSAATAKPKPQLTAAERAALFAAGHGLGD